MGPNLRTSLMGPLLIWNDKFSVVQKTNDVSVADISSLQPRCIDRVLVEGVLNGNKPIVF